MNRSPFYVCFSHGGNPVARWRRDPGWLEAEERRAAEYQVMYFHDFLSHEHGHLGANLCSCLTREERLMLAGIIYRRKQAGLRTGFYIGPRIPRPGQRDGVEGLPRITAGNKTTWDWLARELAPLLKLADVPELPLFIDDYRGQELADFNRAFGCVFPAGGEAWPLDAAGKLDMKWATRHPYWIAENTFVQWDAWGYFPTGVDPGTTALHVVTNDWYYMGKRADGSWDGTWTLTPSQIVALHDAIAARGFIVSGYSVWPEVTAAIVGRSA